METQGGDVLEGMRPVWFGLLAFCLPAIAMADYSRRHEIGLRIHDVSTWVDGRVEFPSVGPSIASPVREEFVTDRKFVERVIAGVPKTPWNEGGGYGLQCQNGLLIVRATPALHRAVAHYLAQLKASKGKGS